jgi:hypothetical protein
MARNEAARQAEIQTLLALLWMDDAPSEKWTRIPARTIQNSIIRGFETNLTFPDGPYVARLMLSSRVVAVGEDNRVREDFSITLIHDEKETVLELNNDARSSERKTAQRVWVRLSTQVPRRPRR